MQVLVFWARHWKNRGTMGSHRGTMVRCSAWRKSEKKSMLKRQCKNVNPSFRWSSVVI
ncbi:hypothetical protein MTR_7g061140 [Medicago truncatula]|uniref:Uncharacterized protein n=1 Tax=Medicago truncatula TaxID=3880 RepID=G7L4I0_MEDTR|nr:hypothetical protein MTR_7g061140 [Medicago truncatula]